LETLNLKNISQMTYIVSRR